VPKSADYPKIKAAYLKKVLGTPSAARCAPGPRPLSAPCCAVSARAVCVASGRARWSARGFLRAPSAVLFVGQPGRQAT